MCGALLVHGNGVQPVEQWSSGAVEPWSRGAVARGSSGSCLVRERDGLLGVHCGECREELCSGAARSRKIKCSDPLATCTLWAGAALAGRDDVERGQTQIRLALQGVTGEPQEGGQPGSLQLTRPSNTRRP